MRLDVEQLHDFAQGCAILGSGGGGDVDAGVMQATAALTASGAIDVLDLDELPDDALVMPVSGWGAPTVGIEKLGSGKEGMTLADAVSRWFGQPVAAVMAGEIGGGNGVLPVAIAAELGLPLVDADGMGRAFPEGPQVSMHVAGLSPSPVFLTDEHGNVVTLHPADGDWYERLARTITVAFGGTSIGADFVMTASNARSVTVRGTVSLALDLGRAVRTGGVDAVTEAGRGHTLLRGKITDVERRTTAGFARGTVTVEGTGDDRGRALEIHVQNENLLATEDGRPAAMTPDLITLVDEATGQAIPTERVRFGHRVAVLAFPCADVWRTDGGLAVAGPAAFGFETPYAPIDSVAHD
jgi:DUF917 family protein